MGDIWIGGILVKVLSINNLKLNNMTQAESIKQAIHGLRLELNKARRVVCKDKIEEMFKDSSIEYYLNEIRDLKFSLKCANEQSQPPETDEQNHVKTPY